MSRIDNALPQPVTEEHLDKCVGGTATSPVQKSTAGEKRLYIGETEKNLTA